LRAARAVVELSKPALGIRVPTGDGFAAPLAVALACGAITLLVVARRHALPGRALAAYVATYCVVRFALEEVRDNPVVLGRFTYYQLLALPLFLLAAATVALRSGRSRAFRGVAGAEGDRGRPTPLSLDQRPPGSY
jgi:hypothetical protein